MDTMDAKLSSLVSFGVLCHKVIFSSNGREFVSELVFLGLQISAGGFRGRISSGSHSETVKP